MLAGFCIGLITGLLFWAIIFSNGLFYRDTPMFIQYPDGTFIRGVRKKQYVNQETRGTHHYMVTDATEKSLIGKRVAIPINSVKYFIIEGK
jgi:hypothetical protein